MKPAAIIDPDLDQAILELEMAERRVRQIEDQLLDGSPERYPFLTQKLQERADLKTQIRTRAEKLNVDPRALALMIREASRLRSKARGRHHVALDKLLAAVREASKRAAIERAELNAEMLAAQERAAVAVHRSAGLSLAVEYLEASRG